MKTYLISLSILFSFAVISQNKVDAKPPLRIVNGTTADDGEFPYLVELRGIAGSFACGGGILAPEWILTAGHCVEDGLMPLSVVYGTNKLYDYEDDYPNTSIAVKTWFQHPNFTKIVDGIPLYDVGLLQLEEPIPLSEKAQPIKLVEAGQEVPFHVQGILAGWGNNWTYGVSAPYLQKVNLTLLSDQECKDKINSYSREDSFRPAHHICSSDYYQGGCYGDSGSPFVVNGTTFGLVSWSYPFCATHPQVYTRLSSPDYRDWIKNVTNI